MTSSSKLTEATVAARQQVATQLAFFQALTTRAFENAERILALNIQTTRATLDQTSGVVRQLATARDPRDLLALGAQSQQHLETAMAYSRKLFEITSKPAVPSSPEPAAAEAPAPVPVAPVVTEPPVIVDEPIAQAAPEPDPVVSAIEPSAHPMGEADPEPAPAMPAKAKPIAKAASRVAAAPLDVPHPAASPMPDAGPVAIPALTPVDAIAEPASPPAKRTKGPKKR
jgi:phasin family protein